MKDKFNNIEMKIYEALGVNLFKKFIFKLRDIALLPITSKMNKRDRYDYLYNTHSNYNIGQRKDLQSLRNFKKYIWFNAGVHIFSLYFCSVSVKNIFSLATNNLAVVLLSTFNIALIVLNIYCIMLQRYNAIRINKTIRKYATLEQKKKAKICNELMVEKQITDNLTHEIIKNKQVRPITFEEFLQTATLEQLKNYHNVLITMQKCSYQYKDYLPINIPLQKRKILKIDKKKEIDI